MARTIPKEESKIKLGKNSKWYHLDELVENQKISDFFHKAIKKDDHGEFYLHNKYQGKEEHVYFEVEDTAYFVVDIDDKFNVKLNTGIEEKLDFDTLKENKLGVMYCSIFDNDKARFTEKALEKLADYSKMDDKGVSVKVDEEKFYISND